MHFIDTFEFTYSILLVCIIKFPKNHSRCWLKDYMEISDKDVSDFLDNFMTKNYSVCSQKEKIITRQLIKIVQSLSKL